MARGTAFTFKGRQVDPRKAGRDLNVEAVVTGKLSQHGENVIITTDLVRVSDGTQLWSNEYNKTLEDVLSVQQEISNEIVKNLKLKLTGEQKKYLDKLPTQNSEAYRLVLKGRYYWLKNTEEDYEKARQYFQKALDLDPTYAFAYHAIAQYYAALALEGIRPPDEAYPKAEAAFNTALHLDPELGDAYASLGRFEYIYKWNWEAAELNFKRARESQSFNLATKIDRSLDSGAVGHAHCLLAVGRFDEATRLAKEASKADPLNRNIAVNYGQILSAAGKDREAIEQLKKTIRLDPQYAIPHFTLAQIYENKSMIREAIAEMIQAYHLQGSEDAADLFREAKDAAGYQEAKNTNARYELEYLAELAKQKYVSPFEFARLHAKLNEKDEAFEWLEKAFRERSAQLIFIRVMDDFKNLRSDPRFNDLVKRIGLPM
jgi:tetratricopeptide (TPR) repeat protein